MLQHYASTSQSIRQDGRVGEVVPSEWSSADRATAGRPGSLMHRHDHPTADQIAEDVAIRLPGVSRTTVYRVLDTLVRISIARKVCHPGAAARFEVESHRHHHLVCVQCGRMIDLEDPRLDKLPFPESQ